MSWECTFCLLAIPILVVLVSPIHGYTIKPISIWEPFCNEEKLYVPYVRVFHKGRHGAMLRDRGPGFIDLSGLKDIYVCTNGLVMLYYEKTTAMGEVYERGELHWSAHHCELYNPSSNNGMKADFPKKCLLSILLIGHPQDYRLPALQMFVAPLYDKVYGGYVNATSLIMIGEDGECLIEKGAERARLRVRISRPDFDGPPAAPAPPPAPGATGPVPKVPEKPPIFCQLDVQRKLGQQKKLITLADPKLTVSSKTPLVIDPIAKSADPPPFDGTPFEKATVGMKKETGSGIYPRFQASKSDAIKGVADLQTLAAIADEVYTALLADRKMRFIGCLRYPYFSPEQIAMLDAKRANLPTDMDKFFTNHTPAATPEFPFWEAKVKQFWLPPAKQTEQDRLTTYAIKFDMPVKDEYKTVHVEPLEKKEVELAAAKVATPLDKDKVAELESEVLELKVKASLWPYIASVAQTHKIVKEICAQSIKLWDDLVKAISEDDGTRTTTTTVAPPPPDPTKPKVPLDLSTLNLFYLALYRKEQLAKISQSVTDRRFDPYNPKLEKQHEELVEEFERVDKAVKEQSMMFGPAISKIETLHSRCKIYKDMFLKAVTDLENAVKTMERTQQPAPMPHGGDPTERTFFDTNIEITNALKDGKEAYKPEDDDFLAAQACKKLPAPKATCKDIKPSSTRAAQMLLNRNGKGLPFEPEDEWRQTVFNLIEKIFVKVCPYVDQEFPIAINRIIKGYLQGTPAGTGLERPVNGSMLEIYDHNYQGIIYNQTYKIIHPSNFTNPKSTDWKPPPKLKAKTDFWDHIIQALEHCEENAVAMQFWHNEDPDKPAYITFRKFFINNNTELHYDVEELVMQEKADHEYAFNWAIDINWRIFATVLGVCMPRYEFKIPLITARFYAMYSQDFLSPLRQIWMSHRDNPILKTILGNFYGTCRGDKWAKTCMESSFVESGDRSYRPPRYLYVNAFTEMNYFVSGPMAGSSGMLGTIGHT